MNNTKNALTLLGIGIAIGTILAVIFIYAFGAKPETVTIGPIGFKIPTQNQTPEILSITFTPSPEKPSVSNTFALPTIHLLLHPSLLKRPIYDCFGMF